MGTCAPPLLAVGDRGPLGSFGAPAVLGTADPAARDADVNLGPIRPAMWRLPIEVPPARRSVQAMAAGVALACHLGLLLILHRLPGQAPQVDGSLEIPIEIVAAIPTARTSDGSDPPTAPAPPVTITEPVETPRSGSASVPPSAPAALDTADATSAARADPSALLVPSHVRPRNTARTPPKPTETAAVVGRAERRRLADTAARRARLAQDAAAPQPRRAARAALHDAPPAATASAEDIAAYSRQVVDRIAAMKHYPEDARARSAQGTVVVAFSLGSAGQVTAAAVRSSSGDASLDGEAVSTVRRAGPFGPPPIGAPRALSVPLRYHI